MFRFVKSIFLYENNIYRDARQVSAPQ